VAAAGREKSDRLKETSLSASLLASFPSILNTFRKRVKIVVTSKRIQMGVQCK